MLTCHGCARNLLLDIIGDIAYLSPAFQALSCTIPRVQSSVPRKHSLNRGFYSSQPYQKSTTGRALKRKDWIVSKNTRAAPCSWKHLYRPSGSSIYPTGLDPLRLAEFVRSTLKRDQVDYATGIIRNASRSLHCVVSWNHLIDWWMSKGKMKSAINVYHEMKKRGQTPDAHTYTIIFRGCSRHEHSQQALGKVFAIYQSMLLDKSPVKPNTIHMNAVLKMCAVAGDIESMLSIVAGMPSSSLCAASSVTFVIVLNSLRHDALSRLPETLSPDQLRENTRKAVLQGQHLWNDVIERWRKRDLWIDEELVCSMGRMLLISEEKQHWDEVLSLVEQTMGIPRQIAPLSSQERWRIEPDCQSQLQPAPSEDSSTDPTMNANSYLQDSSLEANISTNSKNISASFAPEGFTYAKPTQDSLSLVLKALLLLSLKEPAARYWKIFTEEYHVEPDLENYVSYLRILRISRSSTEAFLLVNAMPPKYHVAKIFRLAMGSCVRDKNNHHAFSNAGKVLDIMQSALKEPDIPTAIRYLELALSSMASSKKSSSYYNSGLYADDLGKQILRALDRVQEIILTHKSILFFTGPDMEQKTGSEKQTYVSDFIKLIRLSIGGHDLLVDKNLVPRILHSELKSRLFKLNFLSIRLSKLRRVLGTNRSGNYFDSLKFSG